jgi:hypothetical protein
LATDGLDDRACSLGRSVILQWSERQVGVLQPPETERVELFRDARGCSEEHVPGDEIHRSEHVFERWAWRHGEPEAERRV